ncbi:hypothetical protein O9Z70_06310 [Devosia sp. YIM 151766]|uniref:hypothetical protein n=1 Tax=Devosia sp. YIM 151766 TaxID=3017325 RepID=UPI00255D0E5A|nr:hypothetical protein [Devosia sp. YIM 151766]WIY54130.1 hypothetical protein O9Z70_06310 [Devosia sp. YIM 151766]
MNATYPKVKASSVKFKRDYLRDRRWGKETITDARNALFKTAELMRVRVMSGRGA